MNITTSSLLIDNINEKTSANGVNIESVLLKDSNISTTGTLASGNTTITGTTSISSTLSAATGSTIGTLTLADGSITDSNGAISFGDEFIYNRNIRFWYANYNWIHQLVHHYQQQLLNSWTYISRWFYNW